MDTPIIDFVNKYEEKNAVRMHMPGHKGKNILGFESKDITEIDGADSLFDADGIIKQSEKNAGRIFTADTCYSTEGSSLCIRAMVYLVTLYAKKVGRKPLILAGRNAHKSFLSAAALCDCDVDWIYGDSDSYLSCDITAEGLTHHLRCMDNVPVAIYLTCPDYLGNMVDIASISAVCHGYGIILLVDNAHGAYLNFLWDQTHPIAAGADMCCDSVHKTLPALTGCAYLHLNLNTNEFFKENAKKAMALFASTSPSYLLLQSMDKLNDYLENGVLNDLRIITPNIESLKEELVDYGYTLIGTEPLKITIATKSFGYTGFEFKDIMIKNNIYPEFYDNDYIVFMLSSFTSFDDLNNLKEVLLSVDKKDEITTNPPEIHKPLRAMSIRSAMFSDCEVVNVDDALDRVLADVSVSCPPAVPILVSGEIIDKKSIELLKYYGVKKCSVVKK